MVQPARAARPADAPHSVIPCFDPATLEPLGEVPVDGPDAVAAAVQAARAAQRRWATTSFAERRRVLERVLEHLLGHADELCEAVVRDAGKTRENAMLGEIWPVADKLRWTIRRAERHLRPEKVSSGLLVHKRARIEYHPRGVIGVIAPWNYPLQNLLGPAIPALMAGNAVVLKPSEQVAWSAARFLRIFEEALTACGHSTDLVQIVQGYAATGQALIRSGVDQIIFTGSLPNGRRVLAEAAEQVIPVVLELGGKDPFIVCDDADLEQAVHAAMAGVYIHCGQNCLAAERMLVFDGIYDRYEARLTELVAALRQGPPLGDEVVDCGAMVSPHQIDIVERLVNEAVAAGARVLAGGERALAGQGQFFQPTLLADVTPEMAIYREEVFGPVALLLRVSGEDEAIRLANDTTYGLGCTVLTRSGARARRIHRQIEAGMVSVNDFGLTYMAQELPFGGVKSSGFGRLNGRDGLRACCHPKAVLEDRLPFHQPVKLYPVRRGDYDVARGTIRMLYSRGLGARWRGAVELVRSALGRGK